MIYRDRIAPYLSSSRKPGDRLAALKRRKPRTYLDLPYLAAQRDVTSPPRAQVRVINASRWLARISIPISAAQVSTNRGGGWGGGFAHQRRFDFYRLFLSGDFDEA